MTYHRENGMKNAFKGLSLLALGFFVGYCYVMVKLAKAAVQKPDKFERVMLSITTRARELDSYDRVS